MEHPKNLKFAIVPVKLPVKAVYLYFKLCKEGAAHDGQLPWFGQLLQLWLTANFAP